MMLPLALLLQAAPRSNSLWEFFTATRIISALVILTLAWVAIRWVAKLLNLLAAKAPQSRFFIKWFEPVVRITLWFTAIFLCFELLAPTPETFIAAIASIGIAIGLGAQDLVKNLVGGLVVLTDRPYQLGDRVRIGDAYGEIDHIGLRSTKLTTPDDTRVTIPNADVLSAKVWNANSGVLDCQVVTDLYLPAGTDPDLALRIGHEAACSSPYLLARKPVVALLSDGFDQRPYLKLRVKAYVYDHRFEPRIMSDITARAKREFLRQGIIGPPERSGTSV